MTNPAQEQSTSENISQDKAETKKESAKQAPALLAKKNPDPLAGETGVVNCKAGELRADDTAKRKRLSIPKGARLEHKIAAKVVANALVLGEDFDAWADAAFVLSVRLSTAERAMLAWAALRSLPPDAADRVIDLFPPPLAPVDPGIATAAVDYHAGRARSEVLGAQA